MSTERERVADALEWYAEKAEAAARYMTAKPTKVEAATALLTELALDAGKRAVPVLAALRSPAPLNAQAVEGERIEGYHTFPTGSQMEAYAAEKRRLYPHDPGLILEPGQVRVLRAAPDAQPETENEPHNG